MSKIVAIDHWEQILIALHEDGTIRFGYMKGTQGNAKGDKTFILQWLPVREEE